MLEQWLNTVQQEMSVYTVWITGSDVTGVQREAVFSPDRLWHRTEAEVGLFRLLSGNEIKILQVFELHCVSTPSVMSSCDCFTVRQVYLGVSESLQE